MKAAIVIAMVMALTVAPPSPTQPALAKDQTTQPPTEVPSIDGIWQEAPGVFVTITQAGGKWTAKCAYTLPNFGEVRWEMNGTIEPDSSLRGTLKHTASPANWEQIQTREGTLSQDGNTIAGTVKSDSALNPFSWTRVKADAVVQSLLDEQNRLREKSALARAAIESARAAALHRFSQSLENQQAEAAVANAQKELDDADSDDARIKGATDKVTAKSNIAQLQEKAVETDAGVNDAIKFDAEISAELKLAEDRLAKAEAVERERLAKAQAEEAGAEAAKEAAELAEKQEAAKAEKKVVLSARDFNSLPRGYNTNGGFKAFGSLLLNSVGYISSSKVVDVVDESTSIVQIGLYYQPVKNTFDVLPGTWGQLMIEGMPTKGQADGAYWSLNRWFKIVATKKDEFGNTDFVAWQVVSAEDFHVAPAPDK